MRARLIDFVEEILLRPRQPILACTLASLRLSLRGEERNQQGGRKAQRGESKQSSFHWGIPFISDALIVAIISERVWNARRESALS